MFISMLLLAVCWILLGYVVKPCLDTHRGAQRDYSMLGSPINALHWLPPGHPGSHHPIKGTAPEAQKSSEALR